MDISKLARAWRRSSKDDLKVAHSLNEKGHYSHCLFFCHLAVEKELKRIYLVRKKEIPPFIHNLVRIADECNLALGEPDRQNLQELTTFNVKARYEIIKAKFHKKATKEYTKRWLSRTEEILELLKRIT